MAVVGRTYVSAPVRRKISILPGATDGREVIEKAVEGCDGVLTVLVPWGVSSPRVQGGPSDLRR
ncbi:hypothetical protein FMN52_06710 [Marinobacter sp. BW6]|nr:hypothetical protein FMN52_06710 [Marinobacter sp. BW6]